MVFLPDHIANKLEEGDHGSTYGGNPMAMAAVTAACKVIEKENVVEQANQKGQQFSNILVKNLADLKVVREVRGKGLMIGIDIRFQPGQVLKYLQEKGILAVKAGSTVIRFLPSYLITYENMEEASNVLREGLLKIENKAVSS